MGTAPHLLRTGPHSGPAYSSGGQPPAWPRVGHHGQPSVSSRAGRREPAASNCAAQATARVAPASAARL
eukprot:1982472-Alexandrium_andersonii.AAC.1